MERKIDRQVLEKYLVDHLLASQDCLKRLEVMEALWQGTEQGAKLQFVYEQVRDDRNDLRAIVGRLKLRELGPLWRRRLMPACRVLRARRATGAQMELDAIAGMLHSKQAMWNTLLSLVTSEARLDLVQLITLSERTEQQIRVMNRICEQARPGQFTQPS